MNTYLIMSLITNLKKVNMEEAYITVENAGSDYQQLLDNISVLWKQSRENAIIAVNAEFLESNWQTGRYIVEFEQKGKERAEYGKGLLNALAKDLTVRNGKGFNRSNLTYMRKLYVTFPKRGTLSHKLTWSHYCEILKCDDPMERQFYMSRVLAKAGR